MEPASVPPLSPRRRARERAGTPTRSRMIRIRVSEEEYAALVEKGEAVGGMSQLLRDHLGRVAIRHREDERKRLAMLNRINANLNMISRWVNTHKSAADAVQVLVYLADVRREMGRLLAAMDRPTPQGSGPAGTR